jgi:hypothetical protein
MNARLISRKDSVMKRPWCALATVLALIAVFVFQQVVFAADVQLPTKENPLVVDQEGKRVLIYTEVNDKNLHETNPHWGVVFTDGKLGNKAILKAYAPHLAFHDALEQIGAKPGNNLTEDTLDIPVAGDLLEVTATWPGLAKELTLQEVFYDESGKGFEIRFGGNRQASEAYGTGCITCLESCWISIVSNAKYPNISSAKRFVSPNSRFKGKAEILPGGDRLVVLIYRLVKTE